MNQINRVWIGIGSNLSDPKFQVDRAIWSLSYTVPNTKFIACSTYYRSHPLGFQNQPDFLNAVVILDTYLNPEELLVYIKYIEKEQGRVRKKNVYRWQPRTLDLDILLFGTDVICTAKLTIPHYDMENREFVIYPLFELDSNLIFPNRKVIKNIIKFIPKNGLCFWKN